MISSSNPMPEHDQSEIRLMGLILVQAMTIGLAVGIFDAELWIVLDEPGMNGITYAMAAFAVQGIAYYIFKMFFQQGMDEKARIATQERERRMRYRVMETSFDQRRMDMEMKMQEAQLNAELNWMESNPGKTPPWLESRVVGSSTNTVDFIPEVTKEKAPLSLGIDFSDNEEPVRLKKDGTPDKRYEKKTKA